MVDRDPLERLRPRLRRKTRALLIVVAGGFLVTGILLLALLLLPAELQARLEPVASGDWKGSVRSFKTQLLGWGTEGGRAGIFFLLQLLQVLVSPIPGQVMGALGGYVFGFWVGLGLTMLGLVGGSLIAIGVGRTLGRAVVARMIPGRVMRRFEDLATEGGAMNFFLIFLVPALPDDAVCFIAGLTRIPLSKLMLACLLGRLPGMAVLAYLGSAMETDPTAALVVLGIGIALGVIAWVFDEEFVQLLKTGRPGRDGSGSPS